MSSFVFFASLTTKPLAQVIFFFSKNSGKLRKKKTFFSDTNLPEVVVAVVF